MNGEEKTKELVAEDAGPVASGELPATEPHTAAKVAELLASTNGMPGATDVGTDETARRDLAAVFGIDADSSKLTSLSISPTAYGQVVTMVFAWEPHINPEIQHEMAADSLYYLFTRVERSQTSDPGTAEPTFVMGVTLARLATPEECAKLLEFEVKYDATIQRMKAKASQAPEQQAEPEQSVLDQQMQTLSEAPKLY